MQLRRIIPATFVCCLLASAAGAATFTDTGTSPYERAVLELSARGVVQGYGDGTYRPEASINRAEFLKILLDARFPGREPSDLRCFRDLEVTVPQWYARTICAGRELGIVEGYPDGTFRPERPVAFAEALKMAFLTFGAEVPPASGEWYEPYLSAARVRGILTHLLQQPARSLTRGEMASLTYALVLEQEENDVHPVAGSATCGNGVIEAKEQCDDGNNTDSDGCSSICIAVPEPVRIGILQIDQQTTGSLTTVAKGQQNVALLKFTAVAGRQDVILSDLVFRPSVGSLLYAQHYELAMDRNGDGVYETVAQAEGKATGSRLTFDAMAGGGVLLPQGLIVPFVVRADLASTLGPVSLGLEFDTGLPDYVEATGAIDGIQLEDIETDGSCPSGGCFIRVNTAGSTDITVQQAGNLYVTQDTLPVRSRILVGGTVTDELLRLRLRADGEPVDLKTIRIDGVPSSVDALLFTRVSPGQRVSGNPFAQATHGQCPEQAATRFCVNLGLSTFVVEPQTETVIAVTARMKNDQSGGISGQNVTLTVSSSTSTQLLAIEARGVSSSQTLAQNDGNAGAAGEIFIGVSSPAPNAPITGATHDIALASIGSVTNDGPANSGAVPVGQSVIGAFKVSAVPHTNSFQGQNDVLIQSMAFSVTAQNVQTDPLSYRLSSKDDPSTTVSCSGGQTGGVFTVTCPLSQGAIQNRVPQGQSAVWQLWANVTNPQVSPGTSILTVSLPSLGQRTQTNSILWSDEETSFTWTDVPVTSVSGTLYGN